MPRSRSCSADHLGCDGADADERPLFARQVVLGDTVATGEGLAPPTLRQLGLLGQRGQGEIEGTCDSLK